MSLTLGRAPFGSRPGVFNFERAGPRHVLYFEDSPRLVRVELSGHTVARSARMKLLHETGLPPVYYFPEEDVRRQLLVESDHTSHCPFKGTARYFSVRIGDRRVEDAVWTYPEPIEGAPPLTGYMAFYWDQMDAWYEENEQVYVHARDPYHRIDALESARHVRLSQGGQLVAQSERPVVLFETGLEPRYYLPLEDVRRERLVPSTRHTRCPYKGRADYFSLQLGPRLERDLVWTYPEPLPEAGKIAGLVCFYHERMKLEVS